MFYRRLHEPGPAAERHSRRHSVVHMVLLRARATIFALVIVAITSVVSAANCGDIDGDGTVTAPDALVVLSGAIGLADVCNGNCDCDLDCSRSISAVDAFYVLHWAVFGGGGGCCTADYCFTDDDCEAGYYCGNSPTWCDAVCLPE